MSLEMMESKINLPRMLAGIERYNPMNLPKLESFVEYQVKEGCYNLEANLAVLKHYQFIPSKFNSDICLKILIKALTNMPKADFILCKCLIDPAFFENETIKIAKELHHDLETSQFQHFWEIVNSKPELFVDVKDFHKNIRSYIVYLINITYDKVEKDFIKEILNVSDSDLQPIMEKYHWKDLGDGYLFIADQAEEIKTKNITEKIDFENVFASIIGYK